MTDFLYIVTCQSDLTEGRGPRRNVAYMTDEDAAVELAKEQPGVMGVGTSGEVDIVPLNTPEFTTQRLWGPRTNLVGKFGYGYVDNRDEHKLRDDPEFQEYLRLKEKFGA